nr:MAG TPA: hypothetical protein [Caudoviricetes sp.]
MLFSGKPHGLGGAAQQLQVVQYGFALALWA